MKKEIQKKIDCILDSVIEERSMLSIASLNLVKKISYSPGQKIFRLYISQLGANTGCAACIGFSAAFNESIEKKLINAFKEAFPDCTIEFVTN